jgi:hypothetical protein
MKHIITSTNDTKFSQYEKHHQIVGKNSLNMKSITKLLEKQPILETTLQSTYKSDKKDFYE